MRRVALLALLIVCLPAAMWANSSNLVFQNSGGSISVGAGNSLQLSGSTLTSFTGFNGTVFNGTLGTVNFSTGAMTIGTLGTSGTFAAGGSFTISGNGTNGIGNGVLFTGSFTGPVSWVGTFNPAGNHGLGAWTYVLKGTVSGFLSNGAPVSGETAQFTFDVPKGKPFSTSVRLNQGVTSVTVPEPGTLGLLGTGLLGLAALVRRKLKA
jgi:PEP-CTERM motif-containing protein